MTTDGNTAIPVSPTEESMKLADIFRKAADAVVAASSMPETIARLTRQVESLQAELDQRNQHAQELDQTIHELREQRDGFKHDLHIALTDRDIAFKDRDVHQQRVYDLESEGAALQRERDIARFERDDAQLRVMELEDEVQRWKTRAEEGRKRIADLQSLFAPEPEPTPEPAMQSQSDTATHDYTAPTGAAPAPEMPPVIQPDPEPEDDRPWWEKEQDKPEMPF